MPPMLEPVTSPVVMGSFLYLYPMEKVKAFLSAYGQGIGCAAVSAGLVSASLPTALFFGLSAAIALYVGAQFVNKL